MPTRLLVILVTLGAVALAIVGVPSSGARPAGASGLACPAHDRSVPGSSRPGAASSLVPNGPDAVLLCRYSGLGTAPPSSSRAFRLVDDLLVTETSTVQSLTSQFNGLPGVPLAVICPADFGDAIVAVFRYPSGADNPVRVGLTGCTVASNGHVDRWGALAGGRRLLTQLKAMTSGTGVGISRAVRAALLKDALRDARNAGDKHPYDIEAIKTTYLEAESLFSGDRSSGAPAWAPVYAFAARGHFIAYLAPVPLGAQLPRGTVEGAILTPSLRVTDGYLTHHYPRFSAAGRVVRLR